MDNAFNPLRKDLEVSEQVRAGKCEVVIRDPLNGNVYSFPKRAYEILSRLSTDEPLQGFVASAVGAEPHAQAKLYALLKKAQASGLLQGAEIAASAATPSPRFRLTWVLGEVPLERIAPVISRAVGPLFGWGAVAAFALLGYGLWLLFDMAAIYAEMMYQVFPTYPWWWITAPLVLMSLTWHETGHMAAAMRYGARRMRGGLAVHLLAPAAFVKIDDYQLIPKVWQRTVVSLSGIYFDLLLFSACLAVWAHTLSFSFINQTAYLLSFFVLFRVGLNLLPFFRLDGYKALAEVIGIWRLRERAYHVLLSSISPLREKLRPLPNTSRRLCTGLAAYGIASLGFIVLVVWWTYQLFERLFFTLGPAWSVLIAAGAAAVNGTSLSLDALRDVRGVFRTTKATKV